MKVILHIFQLVEGLQWVAWMKRSNTAVKESAPLKQALVRSPGILQALSFLHGRNRQLKGQKVGKPYEVKQWHGRLGCGGLQENEIRSQLWRFLLQWFRLWKLRQVLIMFDVDLCGSVYALTWRALPPMDRVRMMSRKTGSLVHIGNHLYFEKPEKAGEKKPNSDRFFLTVCQPGNSPPFIPYKKPWWLSDIFLFYFLFFCNNSAYSVVKLWNNPNKKKNKQ